MNDEMKRLIGVEVIEVASDACEVHTGMVDALVGSVGYALGTARIQMCLLCLMRFKEATEATLPKPPPSAHWLTGQELHR